MLKGNTMLKSDTWGSTGTGWRKFSVKLGQAKNSLEDPEGLTFRRMENS